MDKLIYTAMTGASHVMQQQAAVASPLPWALRELVASGVSSPLRPGPAHNCWTGPTSA